jgi:cytochrome c oxidase assembly protein subunit 11
MSRTVTVQFVANNNLGMPWEFGPVVASMQVHPGKLYSTSFTAHNPTGRNMVGQAVPSVAPGKASRYFNKTECFCFNQQPLAAGETKDMPLRFIVDAGRNEMMTALFSGPAGVFLTIYTKT